jgi:hypothetical protein
MKKSTTKTNSKKTAKKNYVVATLTYKWKGSFSTNEEAKEYARSLSKKDGNIYKYGLRDTIKRHAKEDGMTLKY